MVRVIENLSTEVIGFYNEFISFFPPYVGTFFNFLILVLVIVLYVMFIWKFYKFISKKNPLGLTLSKYEKREDISGSKIIESTLYFLEYIILLPFLIFMIFAVFTLFLIAMSQGEVSQILMVSAVVIAAIRATAYYKESLSQDIAKLLPFTLLGVAVLNPNNFTQFHYLENIFTQFNLIPNFFGDILYYLVFIIILEAVLRFFDFIFSLFGLEEVDEELEE